MARLVRAALLAFATFVTISAAADLTGVWTLDLDPDFGGVRDAVECTFKRDVEVLTADCGDGPAITGEVSDQKVTFRVKTGRNNELNCESGQREWRSQGLTYFFIIFSNPT